MVALEAKIDTDTTAEMTTRKKLIESQITQQFSNKKTIFLNKLQELLDKVQTPPALHFVQALSTNPEHCSAFECYRNSHNLADYITDVFPVTPAKNTPNLYFNA